MKAARFVVMGMLTAAALVVVMGSPTSAITSVSFEPQSGPVGTVVTVTGVCDAPGFDEVAVAGLVVARTEFPPVETATSLGQPWQLALTIPEGVGVGSFAAISAACGGTSGNELPVLVGTFEVTGISPPAQPPVTASPEFTG